MTTAIHHTAEQLIREAAKRYALDKGGEPEIILARTIRDLYPSESGEYVRSAVLVNSMAALVKKMEREAMLRESEWQRIGQIPLLGIPEHRVPAKMLGEEITEVLAWADEGERVEVEDLEELERAVRAKRHKVEQRRLTKQAVHMVAQALRDHGIALAGVLYGQAIQIAQTLQPGDDALSQPKAGRKVRPVRPAD